MCPGLSTCSLVQGAGRKPQLSPHPLLQSNKPMDSLVKQNLTLLEDGANGFWRPAALNRALLWIRRAVLDGCSTSPHKTHLLICAPEFSCLIPGLECGLHREEQIDSHSSFQLGLGFCQAQSLPPLCSKALENMESTASKTSRPGNI